MPDRNENERFVNHMFTGGNSFLDSVCDWIDKQLAPDDVFSEKKLDSFISEKISGSSPDDYFSEDELGLWAEKNGFEKVGS